MTADKTVRAAIATAKGEALQIAPVMLDEPRSGELRVRMEACGVCNTDLAAIYGKLPVKYPMVAGHEGVGIVEAVGEDCQGIEVGDRVVISFGACGDCDKCRSGHPAYCDHSEHFLLACCREDGSCSVTHEDSQVGSHFLGQSSFASHAIVSAVNAVKVDQHLDPAILAPLACGFMTGAGAVELALHARPEHSLLVLGCGTVGLAAIMEAKRLGCARIIAADIQQQRLDLAESLGATDKVNTSGDGLKTFLKEIHGCDLVLDTTGISELVSTAWQRLRKQGKLCCVAVPKPGTRIEIDLTSLMGAGKQLIGSVEGDANPQSYIPLLVERISKGDYPIEKLLKRFAFEDIQSAIQATISGEVVKPVLIF